MLRKALTSLWASTTHQSGYRLAHTEAVKDALKICVVGSGPGGFYTADRILKRLDDAVVDIVEALPTPFGLVRSGVAPDHPDTKNVVHHFTDLAKTARVRFLGNVKIGSPALSLTKLRQHYNAVVLAYGAESDRRLNIPGETFQGVFSAREFVWWYNGHPAASDLSVDLSAVTSVAIVGLGNVALDCARVLLRDPEDLGKTDLAGHALHALRSSTVKQVHLVGRRGPAQAACTPKELREIVNLEGIRVFIHPEGCLELEPACQAEIKESRIKRRVVEVLSKVPQDTTCSSNSTEKELHFHFLSSPTEILSAKGGIGSSNGTFVAAGVRVERTQLQQPSGGNSTTGQSAVGTGQFEDLPAQLVLQSVGYRSVPIDGLPFDHNRGIVPNQLGQVLSEDGTRQEPGLFVCGWLKRGPTGIIGTNLVDAEQTVDTLVRARDSLPAIGDVEQSSGNGGIEKLLKNRGVEVVGFEGWEKIDAEERRRGEAIGKPREKIVDVEEMLRIAKGGKRLTCAWRGERGKVFKYI